MCPTFTDDDIGKRVESADGDTIGVVAEIEHETAFVDPEPGMINTIAAVFDWDGSADDTIPVAGDAVANNTADTIQLEAAAPAEAVTSRADPGDDLDHDDRSTADRDDDEYTPGEPVGSTVTDPEIDAGQSDRGVGTDSVDEPISDAAARDDDTERRDDADRHTAADPEPTQEVDPMGEIDESNTTDPERQDPLEKTTDERAPGGDTGERETGTDSRTDLEVDPTELMDDAADDESRSDGDADQRTGHEPETDTSAEGADDERRADEETDQRTVHEPETDTAADGDIDE
ncbi:hypothetical protein G6M89_19435 [Natronolimnobius sp. AArcel1]|uniref:hypothetical protein n=1 Tax=Natronolimnobius sp. AArcel1 TaxID=1679093 RepID=UPI0013EC2269|nr:hypothetical protein [Natronolimnobius sp. AArcel1]NGM71149.1 hypothetical protein [Natronolimnobius sp. AArcel1]